MKVFAIQKFQLNTTPFKQNTQLNQTPIMKTNLSEDKFVSRVSFGAGLPSLTDDAIKLLLEESERLSTRLRKESLNAEQCGAIVKRLREIDDLVPPEKRPEEHPFVTGECDDDNGDGPTLEDELWHRWNG